MTLRKQSWTDQKIQAIIGNLLRLGVLLAAAVTLVGGILFLVRHGMERPDYHIFSSEPPLLRSVTGVVREAVSLSSVGIVQLGLLLLILTPIARVVFSVFGFAEERDRLYVFVTIIVLMLLLFSLAGGRF